MNDIFYIGAYWKNRKQKLDVLLSPTLTLLEGLARMDDQFLDLFEKGNSRSQALKSKVLKTEDELCRLFLKRTKKNDIDSNGYSSIGYRLSFWNGQGDGQASSISFSLGTNSDILSNYVLIDLPSEGVLKERLLQIDIVLQIIELLITNFNPEVIVLNSRRLQAELDSVDDVGWVSYKKNISRKFRMSDDNIVHVSNYMGGHLFYLKNESGKAYNYSSIAHLKGLTKSLF